MSCSEVMRVYRYHPFYLSAMLYLCNVSNFIFLVMWSLLFTSPAWWHMLFVCYLERRQFECTMLIAGITTYLQQHCLFVYFCWSNTVFLFSTYNADFDGDEMNVHFPQDEISRAEAINIVDANKQYIGPRSGDAVRGLIQVTLCICSWDVSVLPHCCCWAHSVVYNQASPFLCIYLFKSMNSSCQ